MTQDLIIHNAKIRTLDPTKPEAEAVLVRNGKIVAVGSETEVRQTEGAAKSESLDLKGSLLIPGLNDAHTHFLWWSESQNAIDLVGAKTLTEALERIKAKVSQTKESVLLRGRGWDKNYWGGWPTKQDLDKVTPGNPVILDSKDGHAVWTNSLFMQQAGIKRDLPDIAGGEVVRDENGELTGVFKENATQPARQYLASIETDLELAAQTIAEGQKLAHQTGLTGVHAIEAASGFAAFQELHLRGALDFRSQSYFAPRCLWVAGQNRFTQWLWRRDVAARSS